jgi:hypothetical protein
MVATLNLVSAEQDFNILQVLKAVVTNRFENLPTLTKDLKDFLNDASIFERIIESNHAQLKEIKKELYYYNFWLSWFKKSLQSIDRQDLVQNAREWLESLTNFAEVVTEAYATTNKILKRKKLVDEDSPEFQEFLCWLAEEAINKDREQNPKRKTYNNVNDLINALQS